MDVFELYRSAERLLAQGDVREAVRRLERAAELEPESTAVRRLLARAYFKSAALGRSEEAARAVVHRDPADAETMHLLGRCLTRQGRADEAARWLRLAAAMDPRPEYALAPEVEITDDSSQFEFDIELG